MKLSEKLWVRLNWKDEMPQRDRNGPENLSPICRTTKYWLKWKMGMEKSSFFYKEWLTATMQQDIRFIGRMQQWLQIVHKMCTSHACPVSNEQLCRTKTKTTCTPVLLFSTNCNEVRVSGVLPTIHKTQNLFGDQFQYQVSQLRQKWSNSSGNWKKNWAEILRALGGKVFYI